MTGIEGVTSRPVRKIRAVGVGRPAPPGDFGGARRTGIEPPRSTYHGGIPQTNEAAMLRCARAACHHRCQSTEPSAGAADPTSASADSPVCADTEPRCPGAVVD